MKRHQRSLVLIFAAIAFLIQSVLSITTAAAMPLGLQVDAYGNPLCVTRIDDSGESEKQPPAHHVPDCCAFGCNLLPQPLAGSSAEVAVLKQARPVRLAILVFRNTPALISFEHDPGRPRAPPLTH